MVFTSEIVTLIGHKYLDLDDLNCCIEYDAKNIQ
jgi:hypothetical protein